MNEHGGLCPPCFFCAVYNLGTAIRSSIKDEHLQTSWKVNRHAIDHIIIAVKNSDLRKILSPRPH